MPKPSPRQRLADLLLGRPVVSFIADQRADGASYNQIAKELREITKGEIDVTPEAVRQWHAAGAAA